MPLLTLTHKPPYPHTQTHTPIKVEAKSWLVHQLLVDHVKEDWSHTIHCYAGIGHSQYAIKLSSNKSDAWLFGGFPKRLLLDSYASDLREEGLGTWYTSIGPSPFNLQIYNATYSTIQSPRR